MSSPMAMADFNKRLLDLETKVIGQGEKIEALQDTTKRIESQLEQNQNESKKDQGVFSDKVDQAMVLLICICNKLKVTPDQIL